MKDYFTVSKNQYFQSIFHNEEMCLEATIVQSNQGTPRRKAWNSANAKLTSFVENTKRHKSHLSLYSEKLFTSLSDFEILKFSKNTF